MRPRTRWKNGAVNVLGVPDVRSVPVYVYGLVDPTDGSVRYVGKSDRPKYRVTTHLSCSAAKPVRAWVEDLATAGLRPQLVILHAVQPGEDSAPWEMHYILHFRQHGRLLNCRFSAERVAANRTPASTPEPASEPVPNGDHGSAA